MQQKFDFNDILIVPKDHSDIESRYSDVILPPIFPLFTAPMDTVVGLDNCQTYLDNKINVVLPRTIKIGDIRNSGKSSTIYYSESFISLGFSDIEIALKNNFCEYREYSNILIDVANGHMEKIVEYCKQIKEIKPYISIMVGNIANPKTYLWYAESQVVDYIRVSIGSGNACTTSANGSVGYGIASLIDETYKIKKQFQLDNPTLIAPKIVADGGMKNYSDVVKAIYLGADYVMVGSLFNKAIESSGDNYFYKIKISSKIANYLFDKGFKIKKHYRGMSTKAAQKAMGNNKLRTSEGVTRYRNVEYHLSGWVENFEHYLRSAMSYAGCRTLDEFRGQGNYCFITENSFRRFNK